MPSCMPFEETCNWKILKIPFSKLQLVGGFIMQDALQLPTESYSMSIQGKHF